MTHLRWRLHGIGIPHDGDPDKEIPKVIAERLGELAPYLDGYTVVRRSVDARQRAVKLVFSVDLAMAEGTPPEPPAGAVAPAEQVELRVEPGAEPLSSSPVVVGAGPAGLFAALLLAEHGFAPVLLERGGDLAERRRSMGALARERTPDPECNALFGLGGAGTYSDGKLTTGIRHPWLGRVLEVLVDCGAPERVKVDARPHIGTDVLEGVVTRLVERIEAAGGTVRTSTRMDRLRTEGGRVVGLGAAGESMEAGAVVLAIGHSAADTWELLSEAGVAIEPKPFQMGVRVEHPQEWVDRAQYGGAAGSPALGAADYRLATRVHGVPVFSFCMCPGGHTMATVNEPGRLALNGMSMSARDSEFASSGVVVTLAPEVYGGTDLASCLAYRRRVEEICFRAGGEDYSAPAQRLKDLVAGRGSQGELPRTSYGMGVVKARLDELLPDEIVAPLSGGLVAFDRSLYGYLHPEGLALAPESRASSPVRIARDPKTLQSVTTAGLYPAGEGAGYAGGIMSSALDGLEAARAIISRYAPPR